MRVEEGFQPIPYPEDNPYTSDPVLPALLRRTLPPNAFNEIEPDLVRLGADVITTIRAMGSGNRVAPPSLIQYDQWGRRVDELETSEGWRDLKAVSQKEGLPGIFYERKYQEHSRTYGFAKMMLMVGDSHEVFCPLSMTDGTARVIELIGNKEMKEKILPRLISRDPSFAFTSGQWMTERPGGSDVSQTETTATSTGKTNPFGPQYTLNGFKWFSSATDSHISVALARTGPPTAGSRGLSLFLVPLRLPLLRSPTDPVPPSTSNNIFVHRMKNKIGTQILPTAELSLESSEAYLIGTLNQGIKNISPVLNITRLWSATASIGGLRKCLAIATAFARVRKINGQTVLLQDSPLHVSQLASINLTYRALVHLTFGVVGLLGKVECGVASEGEERRLRVLTPIAKAFAAEKACHGMEEAMTALGGAGYMEENGFGRQIRDSLVEKIWEGTTTVLALDLARAAQDPKTLNAFVSWAKDVVSSCPQALQIQMQQPLEVLNEAIVELSGSFGRPIGTLIPRPALMVTGYIASSAFLLEHAIWAYTVGDAARDTDIEVFSRWVLEGGTAAAIDDLRRAKEGTEGRVKANLAMVFGEAARAKL
ncbi:Acyl-CoA dehydrogenase family member 11 [Hypsizygus marmoreus]|uniref:Acyl-CoA dehydrogenase family member 11 n=1 Tax=Hypsizygus marmoreus TaxID=39966 RepID=A0A369JB36_HYPMA|nr:Acyl-CoA dehydrogenase family member 11 [Hypsizygus marmoreus]